MIISIECNRIFVVVVVVVAAAVGIRISFTESG